MERTRHFLCLNRVRECVHTILLLPTVVNDLFLTVIQEKLQISIKPLPVKVNFYV